MNNKVLVASILISVLISGCSLDEVRPDINVEGNVRLILPSDLEEKKENTEDTEDSGVGGGGPTTPSGTSSFVDGKQYGAYIVKQYDSIHSAITSNAVDDSALDNIYFGIYYSGMTDVGDGRLEPASSFSKMHKSSGDTVSGIAFAQTMLNLSKHSVSSSYHLSSQGKRMLDVIEELLGKSENPDNQITGSDTYESLCRKVEESNLKLGKDLDCLLSAMRLEPSKMLTTYRSAYQSVHRGLVNDAKTLMYLFPSLSVDVPVSKVQQKSYQIFNDRDGNTPIGSVTSFFNSDVSPDINYTGVVRDDNSIMKVAVDANYSLVVYLGCTGGTSLKNLLDDYSSVMSKVLAIAAPNQISGFDKDSVIKPQER